MDILEELKKEIDNNKKRTARQKALDNLGEDYMYMLDGYARCLEWISNVIREKEEENLKNN